MAANNDDFQSLMLTPASGQECHQRCHANEARNPGHRLEQVTVHNYGVAPSEISVLFGARFALQDLLNVCGEHLDSSVLKLPKNRNGRTAGIQNSARQGDRPNKTVHTYS